MKTPKYTPGPWMRQLDYEAKDKRPPYNVWSIIGNTNADERKHSIVATTITDDDDARLIAFAPELFARLKEITRKCHMPPEGSICKDAQVHPDLIKCAKALITKIEEGNL